MMVVLVELDLKRSRAPRRRLEATVRVSPISGIPMHSGGSSVRRDICPVMDGRPFSEL